MAQKIATLEIELLMATAQAVSDMARFGGVVDKQSADAIKALDRIDAAMQGIGDLSAAEKSMVRFAETTAKSAVDAAREFNRIERAGESMSAQLERQISTFGKTADEIRNLKAETAALAAEQAGQIELAERIRAQMATLAEMEATATARKEEEATAVRAAAGAYQLFEARAREAMQVYRDQQAANAAAQKEEEARAVRDAAVAYQMFEARARSAAQAAKEAEEASARDAIAVQRLREMLDPAAASQARLTSAIDEARRVMIAAGFTAEEMAKVEQLLVKSGGDVTTSHNRMGIAGMEGMHVMRAFSDSIAAGQSPMTALTMEMGRITEATGLWAAQTDRTEGAVGKLAGFMGGPWGIALTVALVAFAPLVEKMFEGEQASDKFAQALTTEKGAIEALDEATGRLHRTKQQEIDQSDQATKKFLAEALARRQLLAAQLSNYENVAQKPGISVGPDVVSGAAIGSMVSSSQLASNTAEIKRLQEALSGTGFANAVNAATAAVNKSAKATQEYEATLVRIQAEWDRSDKTARDQEAVTKLMTIAQQKRDEATKASSGSAIADADALARQATAVGAVAKAQANLAVVKREEAAQLKAGTTTQAQATAAIETARQAVNAAVADDKAARNARVQNRKDEAAATRDAAAAERQRETDLKQEYAAEKHLRETLAAGGTPPPLFDMPKLIKEMKLPEVMTDIFKQAADAAAEQWKKLDDQVSTTASHMKDAFGGVGGAIGDAMKTLEDYSHKQKEIDDQVADGKKSQAEGIKDSADLQLNSMIGLTSAAKGLFKEHSAGYKAMEAAEKALTIVQLARTVVSVGQAIAEQAKLPFPANLAAMAATAAALLSFGIAVAGGGGGTSAADYSKGNTGIGTVLGDSSAQSDSIKRSIDALGDIDHATMIYSSQMLEALKSIDSKIGSAAAEIARTGTANAASATVSTGFNTDAIGSILSHVPLIGGFLSSLFGTMTSVIGSGITAVPKSLGDIVTTGYDELSYADIEKQKKFLGLTTSTKFSTQIGAGDPAVATQFTLIFQSLYKAIEATAGPLGVATDDIKDRLNSFVIDLGKIDLQGLSGDDIEKKLSAVFSAASDSIAEAVLPGFEKFQAVGEGYFETLVRVASTVEAVTQSLDELGISSQQLGIDAKMGIAAQFDSVSDYQSAVGSYFSTFYTDAEQTAAKTAELGKVFTSLGVALPDSIANFRALVDAQDLSTDAGQQMYAELIKLAPAFASITTSTQAATNAAAILRERQDLEKQLLEAQGNTAALRALELASLDPTNRAIQQMIYDLADQKTAADAAAQAASDLAQAQQQAADEAAQAAAAVAQAAAAVAQERAGLMEQLWQLNGDTASIRAAQLASLDESNRALQQQIYDLTDSQAASAAAQQQAEAAAQAAQQLADAWKSIGDSIMDEVARIHGLTSSESDSFIALQGRFNAATTAARAGDQSAAQSLPDLSKSLLDAAALVATSQQELRRIEAATAASLEQTAGLVSGVVAASDAATSGFGSSSSTSTADTQWWSTFGAAATAGAGSNDNAQLDALRDEISTTREQLTSALAQVAQQVRRGSDVLVNTSNASGGDAFTVETRGTVLTKDAA